MSSSLTGSHEDVKIFGMSLMKRLKSVVLRLQPCFTPTWDWKKGVIPLSTLTADLTEEYRLSNIKINFLLQPYLISF